MRRFIAISLSLVLASCAAAPEQVPTPVPVAVQTPAERNEIIGMTAQELVARLGSPALQVREGVSLKLQFRGPRCVMDAYLYPSGSAGALKVTHIDTRLPSGTDTDQAACVTSFRS